MQHGISEFVPSRKYRFCGGALSLNFTNTVGGHRRGTAREHMGSVVDYLSWSEQVGLISKSEAAALFKRATHHPEESATVLARALGLREAIYEIFEAVMLEKRPPEFAIKCLNEELARTSANLAIASEGKAFALNWRRVGETLDGALGPIARSAADLLTSDHLVSHVSQCGGDNCGWLFLDISRNHSRRWCDMRDCGNRAKVRRHRQKLSTEKGPG
jgi:predicted RNA-binding Zn ribbon-like protein